MKILPINCPRVLLFMHDGNLDSQVLTDDMSLECKTTKHALYTAFGFLMMLSPIGGAIGTPAAYVFVLWWHKYRVGGPATPDPESQKKVGSRNMHT